MILSNKVASRILQFGLGCGDRCAEFDPAAGRFSPPVNFCARCKFKGRGQELAGSFFLTFGLIAEGLGGFCNIVCSGWAYISHRVGGRLLAAALEFLGVGNGGVGWWVVCRWPGTHGVLTRIREFSLGAGSGVVVPNGPPEVKYVCLPP